MVPGLRVHDAVVLVVRCVRCGVLLEGVVRLEEPEVVGVLVRSLARVGAEAFVWGGLGVGLVPVALGLRGRGSVLGCVWVRTSSWVD